MFVHPWQLLYGASHPLPLKDEQGNAVWRGHALMAIDLTRMYQTSPQTRSHADIHPALPIANMSLKSATVATIGCMATTQTPQMRTHACSHVGITQRVSSHLIVREATLHGNCAAGHMQARASSRQALTAGECKHPCMHACMKWLHAPPKLTRSTSPAEL